MGKTRRTIRKMIIFAKKLVGKEVNLAIQVKCNREIHGEAYGGWCICPDNIDHDSIVYSFGVGEDISFDISLIEKYKCRVFAFDPTPRSIQWVKSQKLPMEFRMHEFGLADYDGTAKFYPPANPLHVSHTMLDEFGTESSSIEVPVLTLETIMKKLGHKHIDICKMDIEGGEYKAIEYMLLRSNIRPRQVLSEFHHRFSCLSIQHTLDAIKLLNQFGYKLFNISASSEEYSFILSDRDSSLP